ncbi:MAG: DUF1311 domain-containing protein [Candidatus Aminicenantes bacterium]|nr:DUF1311 domain-containing protein [Candidatus Aminicenantes bacterium]
MRRLIVSLILAAGLGSLLGLPSGQGLAPDRYYGAADNGLLIRIEEDEGRALYLQATLVDDHGRSRQLLRPLRLEPAAGDGRAYEEAGPARKSTAKVRVLFEKDDSALQWLQPAQLKTADGASVKIAGRHSLLSEASRRAAAERHFTLADKGLNEVYRRLRANMTPGDFAELRLNQLSWLKYRDHFIADGDDWDINGPGSIPFRQAQTARTLERTDFLLALERPPKGDPLLGGRYSDGIDWELRLDEIPQDGDRLFFLLQYSPSFRRGPEWPLPAAVSGIGSPGEDGRSWNLAGKPVMKNAEESESGLILAPSADRRSLTVSGTKPAPFNVKLYRTAEPAPAETPMRSLLLRLPAEIFDETTEGLDEAGKAGLARTGASGLFRLEEPAADFLRVWYPEGRVEIRRFPGSDGGAAIAVATANLRARAFGLWRIPAADEAPQPWPLERALPTLGASDFYEDPSDASAASRGLVEYRLFSGLAEVQAVWTGLNEGPEPDIDIDLAWNGVGFDILRSARPVQRHRS